MDLFAQINNKIQELFGNEVDTQLVANRGMYRLYELTAGESSYIARLCHPDQKDEVQAKIFKETNILRGDLRSKNVPVPKIIYSSIENSRQNPVFMIMEKMDGITLKDIWLHLDDTEKISIASELGDYMKIIHDISFPEFGEIGSTENFDSWRQYLKHKLMNSLDYLHLNKAISPDLFTKVKFFITDHYGTIPDIKIPKLVHNDLNAKNILIDMSGDLPSISGIIDWEMSFAGEPSYDLTQIDSLFHNTDNLISAFFFNYSEDPRKDNQWYYRRKIYLIDKFIQNAYYHHRGGTYDLQRKRLTEFMVETMFRFVS